MPFVLSLNIVLQDMGMMVTSLIGSSIELVVELAPDLTFIKPTRCRSGR